MAIEPEASVLGKKEYWDEVYTKELENFDEIGDEGEVWFGEDVLDSMLQCLEKISGITKRTAICDLGCGNGITLFKLAERGYQNLTGFDYSPYAIQLATKIAQKRNLQNVVSFKVVDFTAEIPSERFEVVLDKGTYDAICLNADRSLRDKYITCVKTLLSDGGYFGITSCNFTQDEVLSNFQTQGFQYVSSVRYPTFSFGGHQGQRVCTVYFSYKLK